MRIEGEMNIYRAAELRDALLAEMAGEGELLLELDAVDTMDTAGVQLLLAARRAAEAAGRKLALVSPSADVLQALATLGLDQRFEVRA